MYGAPDLVFCYAGPFWYTKIAHWYTKIAQSVYKNCTLGIQKLHKTKSPKTLCFISQNELVYKNCTVGIQKLHTRYTKIAQWYTKIAQLVYKNCTKLIPKDSSGGAFGLTLPARIIFKKKVIGPKFFFLKIIKKYREFYFRK